MENSAKLHIDFGIPEHGWLPTILKYQDYHLEVDISDVPTDPMVQLCDALMQISKGIKKPNSITWHLEPYCYHLQLLIVDGKYKMLIMESEDLDSPITISKEISGDFESIILPLYRTIKKFWSHAYKPPHWDELKPERIDELTQLIKDKRT